MYLTLITFNLRNYFLQNVTADIPRNHCALFVVINEQPKQAWHGEALPCARLVREPQHLILKAGRGCWPCCPRPLLKMSDRPLARFQAYLLLISPH